VALHAGGGQADARPGVEPAVQHHQFRLARRHQEKPRAVRRFARRLSLASSRVLTIRVLGTCDLHGEGFEEAERMAVRPRSGRPT
jgi:hypothetical protein